MEEDKVEEIVVSVLTAGVAMVDSLEDDEKELEVLLKLAPLVAVMLPTNHTVSLGNVTNIVSTTVVGTHISGPPASVFIAVGICSTVT